MVSAKIYEVTISHARSAPLRNVFRYRGYLWLVDLDHLPQVPWLAHFRARDHLGDPRSSIRANLNRFLAARPWPAPCSARRWLGFRCGFAWRTAVLIHGGLIHGGLIHGGCTAAGDRRPRSCTSTGPASSSAGSARPA